jgi:hypothetical protein
MYYKLSCPVPKEQRPINEYLELVQSKFFNWPMLKTPHYRKKIVQVYLLCFIISLPFSSLFFSVFQSTTKFIIMNNIVSSILIFFIIIRLILGWTYIKDRLYNPKIFYEESGWYDGRIWVKSKNILVQDRLILAYQVLPVIKNLNKALLLNGCLLIGLLLLLNLI